MALIPQAEKEILVAEFQGHDERQVAAVKYGNFRIEIEWGECGACFGTVKVGRSKTRVTMQGVSVAGVVAEFGVFVENFVDLLTAAAPKVEPQPKVAQLAEDAND